VLEDLKEKHGIVIPEDTYGSIVDSKLKLNRSDGEIIKGRDFTERLKWEGRKSLSSRRISACSSFYDPPSSFAWALKT